MAMKNPFKLDDLQGRWDKLPWFIRWLLASFFLGLLGVVIQALTGFSFSAKAQSVTVLIPRADTVYFNGPLTSESVQAVIEKIDNDQKIVAISINSGGGWPIPAKLLADKILERHLSVEVRYHCLSACLLYVFPAGTTRSVTENTVLGFHSAPAFDYVQLRTLVTPAEIETSKVVYDSFTEVLSASRADTRLLLEHGEMLAPICWGYQMSTTGVKEAVIYYNFSIWLPRKDYFESRGLPFSGRLMTDLGLSDRRMINLLKKPERLGPRIGLRGSALPVRFGPLDENSARQTSNGQPMKRCSS
jgi:hypothetical protein